MRYMFYADPGHGWLRVKIKEIQKMGISQEISCYSYKKNDYAYLEEDRDAAIFFRKYKEIHGIEPEIKVSHTNTISRIRRLESWK